METNHKRRLHHAWTKLRRIKPWYFLALALASGIICVFALRANNLKMVQLRQAVYQADKDNGDVEGALRALRVQVYGHMNTSLAAGPNAVRPPIQLKYTYERLVASKQAQLQAATAGNENLYNQAQKYCEKTIPNGFSGGFRLGCITDYIKQHSLNANLAAVDTTIPKNLYQFDFRAAKWSPDLAGWSLVATVFFFLCFAGRLAAGLVLRHRLS